MGGGGGGGPEFSRPSPSLQRKVEEALDREKERLQADVNNYLEKLLAKINNRNVDLDRTRLEGLRKCLGTGIEVDELLLGGSVAKHTAVDGISDIDGLVVIDRADLQGRAPTEVLEALRQILAKAPPSEQIAEVEKGRLAVTVRYADGREIQLLPSMRTGKVFTIPDASGQAWRRIDPSAFRKALTRANAATNDALVPSIKLVKAINDSLPAQKRMTGYHIEALAVDAVAEYQGPKTPKVVFEHVLKHSAGRVLRPIRDITGQTPIVDDYLGKADSVERRNVSQALESIRRRLDAATSVTDWKSILEG